ncbi:lipopolysaccharide assembly protein LapB [Corallincola holothuriorum]|uniref:Lipopolysaccharide assembly protein B n=1 Tax=Corallincola holothuriorum TaxID=2282215 RepID=A0A368NQI9_9GAMM|nr:lipopolysaccharide assembly protein LapB [Corallincola holothuriorum]RCU52812.1 lipopolysaccharide assembly protein LapB [Corallincola holothuriorum]
MSELLFLLLPIAVAYGWYMGRRSGDQELKDTSLKLSEKYVAGLNYLFSDQSDKAVDLFIDMIKVDSETIDTHLALASLFRKRGEVDRAIRLHQNLIARPSLPIEQRDFAMFELGHDYLVAGLFDRAETIFIELLEHEGYQLKSAEQLLHIYEYTKDWEKAVAVVESYKLQQKAKIATSLAHYYCELAEPLLARGDNDGLKLINQALKADNACIRAYLLKASVLIEKGDRKGALKCYQEIPNQDVDFCSEIVAAVEDLYQGHRDPKGFEHFLRDLLQLGAGVSILIKLAQRVAITDGDDAAEALVRQELVRHPTMKGFCHLMHYHINSAESSKARSSLKSLQELVSTQIRIKPKYRCCNCGFSSGSLLWQCPSCKSWGRIKPIRGLDGE